MINTFFETLEWTSEDDPTVSLVSFGALMDIVDMSNRYVYLGSMTTPPCS